VERRLDRDVVPEQVRAQLLAELRVVDEEGVRQALLAGQQPVEQRLQLRRRDVVRQVQLRACAARITLMDGIRWSAVLGLRRKAETEP